MFVITLFSPLWCLSLLCISGELTVGHLSLHFVELNSLVFSSGEDVSAILISLSLYLLQTEVVSVLPAVANILDSI